MLRPALSAVVALLALALVVESWARGYLPGDPHAVAGRMRNVVSLGSIGTGLAVASLLPLGPVLRTVLLALAVVAVLAALAYRLGWL